MKLVRWGERGQERPGLMNDDGRLLDLSDQVRDIDAALLSPEGLARLNRLDLTRLPEVPERPRLGVPLSGVGNLLGIGLNYRDHAAESGQPLPVEPVVFSKHTGALSGANDPIPLPPGAERLDWEVELAVVIGTLARRVSPERALDHVAGYTICNDVSERAFQFDRGGQWIKGKSCDGFAPLGPWLVTADEIPDPQNLRLWTEVNGQRVQDGTTADMVFGVAAIIANLSQYMTLLPGDVVTTGTPAGVGLGRNVYLKAGDVVRLSVQNLGEQRQSVVAVE